MWESPGLKPDWLGEISSCWIKNSKTLKTFCNKLVAQESHQKQAATKSTVIF